MGRTLKEIQEQWNRDMDMHGFRKIPGFPSYEITRFGEIRNAHTKRYMKPVMNGKTAYFSVINEDKERQTMSRSALKKLAFPGGEHDGWVPEGAIVTQ